MPGTRTAPAVTAGATSLLVTIHLIDASGDLFTDAISTTVALGTAVNIEALVAEYQSQSNASVWKVTTAQAWEGAALTSNALAEYRGSVRDGINMLFKDISTNTTQTPRLIAPIANTMEDDTDTPNLVNLTNLVAAYDALLPANYSIASAQFTERRERTNNPRAKF